MSLASLPAQTVSSECCLLCERLRVYEHMMLSVLATHSSDEMRLFRMQPGPSTSIVLPDSLSRASNTVRSLNDRLLSAMKLAGFAARDPHGHNNCKKTALQRMG